MASTPPELQLQLQVAMRALVDALNHSDEALQAEVIRELEQRTGFSVRTAEQEAALRSLARLADVEADKGMAETISLEDADLWYASRLVELRERARLPLRRDEIVEFLSRGYENCAQNFEACRCVPIHKGNQHSWPIGHAVVFTWTDDDGPHRAIDDMLDVMEIDAVRTSFEGRDAIVGLLGDRRTHQPLNLNSPTPIRHALRQTQQVVSELRLSVQHTAFAWPLRAHYLAFCNLRP
jgi:hypothetical protein